jgi:pyruvate, water dikinase
MPLRHFSEINKGSLAIAGGKGSHLGELTSAGFNVPTGFIVTTHAYFDFLQRNQLMEKILAKTDDLDVEDTEKLDKVAEEVREMVLAAKFNDELVVNISKSLSGFSAEKFAVRSSATAEDLPGASFAGQQDTYLNISKDKIAENIQKCFASLFTARAIYYRNKNNFKHDVGMAVVIQEMVDPDFAGVMFTVDPIFKKDILIEAASGLGEKVVSGTVTPNNYFIDRENFNIKQKQEEEFFEEKFILEIAKIGKKIEAHYGSPQDVEFAVKDGKIHILQSRPITTL